MHDTQPPTKTQARRLWLVRHGATVWTVEKRFCGHSDQLLSVQGEKQAQWAAEQLHRQPIVGIYASDLQRAQHTAQLIVAQLPEPLAIQTSSEWRELFFGDWEGLTYAQIAEQYPQQLNFFTDPLHASPVHGESLTGLVQRVQAAWLSLAQDSLQLPAGDLVLVSHGGVLRVLLCSVLGIPFAQQWKLRFDPGSISAIDFLPAGDDPLATATVPLLNSHASGLA